MAITKNAGRQHTIVGDADISFADFDTAIIGTASTSTMTAINLPENAVITGGELVVDTAWNTTGVKATAILTSSAAPADTNTVTINSIVYTFKTALTASTTAYEVLIGISEATSLNNLAAAINGGAGAGTLYGSLTTINASVTAVSNGVHTLTITAIADGTAANSYGTTETHANATWGGSVMSGGLASADTFTVKIGSETYLSATSINATSRTALVPTGTALSSFDTLDVTWDVANTTTVAPTAGSARLTVEYFVEGRSMFTQG